MASQQVLEALETLHREIEKLEPAVKHVEIAQKVIETVKAIPQKHLDLMEAVQHEDEKYKEEIKILFAKELSQFTEENKRLQIITSEIQNLAKLELEGLIRLKNTVLAFHERVEKINFPERLDKLDANLAGIIITTQSLQGRLDGLERNILDRLRDIQDIQKDTRTTLQNNLDQLKLSIQSEVSSAAKKQQTLIYITWALVFVSIIVTTVLKVL